MFLGCSFLFKHKTAYEMRISDWSSDVCSSDLQSQRVQIARSVRVRDPFGRPRGARRETQATGRGLVETAPGGIVARRGDRGLERGDRTFALWGLEVRRHPVDHEIGRAHV